MEGKKPDFLQSAKWPEVRILLRKRNNTLSVNLAVNKLVMEDVITIFLFFLRTRGF